jgi:hypothetical protein
MLAQGGLAPPVLRSGLRDWYRGHVPNDVKAIGLTLFGVALALASYGVWLMATEDVQGGRDVAGNIFLAAAAVTALLGSLAIWSLRRR